MIDDNMHVELAKCCVRACHVLKAVAEGRGVDNLSDPSRKEIGSLGRCVDPASSSLLTIMSGTSTVRHIESVMSARANCARDLWEHRPSPTRECLVA
jgi:hypothetical protein